MEGQYITPLDLSRGLAPTKVTFGIDFPGCSTLDPIKVSYHNIDWFEPGRSNTFRQYQKSSDINPQLAPMCVCVKPLPPSNPRICPSHRPTTDHPPYRFLVEGILIAEVFDDFLNHVEGGVSSFPAIEESLVLSINNGRQNLAAPIHWDSPRAYAYRSQGDYAIHGYQPALENIRYCEPWTMISVFEPKEGDALINWQAHLMNGMYLRDPENPTSDLVEGWNITVAIGGNQSGVNGCNASATYVVDPDNAKPYFMGVFKLRGVETYGAFPRNEELISYVDIWAQNAFPPSIELVEAV